MASPVVYVLIAPLFLVYTTPLPAEVSKPTAQLIRKAVHETTEQTDLVLIDVEQTIVVDQEDAKEKGDIEIITESSPNITDPGCVEEWIDVPMQGKLLSSCEQLCGGDEMLPERENRSCVLVKETYPNGNPKMVLLGACDGGSCVPKDLQSMILLPENATIEEGVATESQTLPVKTEEPSAPKCENVTFIGDAQPSVVTKCEETCGDSVITIPDNTTCIHEARNGTPDVMGICKGGKCVREIENPEKGPTDKCKNHRTTVGNESVYLLCLYTCEGDEVMSVPDGERCVLSENVNGSAYDGSHHLTLGVCRAEACVPRNISTEETTMASSPKNVPETDKPSEAVFNESCYENVIDVPGKGKRLTRCDETCGGDEVLVLGDSTPCAVINESYPNGTKVITLGRCIDGFCRVYYPLDIIALEGNSTTEVVTANEQEEIPPLETESPSRPQCENVSFIVGDEEAAVTQCTDPCGDEIRLIPENTACIHNTSTEESPVLGKCKEGECVLEAVNPKKGPKDPCKNHEIHVNNETVYLDCTYNCEEDEARTAPNGALCYLDDGNNPYNARRTGRCYSGRCHKEEIEIITDNPPTGRPKCKNPNVVYHNKTIAVSQCQFPCGDMMELEPEDVTCVPDMHKNHGGYYTVGRCREGYCVTDFKGANLSGPPDSCSRHRINTTEELVYLTCTFSCEKDEMFSLFQGEPCVLPEGESQLDSYTESYAVGMCVGGQCVKRNDTAVVDGSTVGSDTATNATSTDTNGLTEVGETTTVNVEAPAGGELLAVE